VNRITKTEFRGQGSGVRIKDQGLRIENGEQSEPSIVGGWRIEDRERGSGLRIKR
jgi:hypothetical protein